MDAALVMDVKNEPQVLASIIFLAGPLAGKTYPVTGSSITLGRDPSNTIVISEPSVSRHHARISFANGVWIISKLSPQNRLLVNQRDLSEGLLHHGDTVALGSGATTFSFQVMAHTPTRSQEQTPSGGRDEAPMSPHVVLKTPTQDNITPDPFQATFEEAARYNDAPPMPQQPFPAQSDPALSPIGPQGTERALYIDHGAVRQGIPTLEISNNTNRDRQTYELNKPTMTIGRAPDNDIVINVPTVSAYHALIERQGNQLVFIHPNPKRGHTRNGIIYNGRRVAGDEQFRKVLTRGDVCRISDEHDTYVTLTYNDGSGAAQETKTEMRPLPLGAAVITIGRAPDNMVVLSHPQVSAHHARLEQVQGGYRIIDLNSTNHVYVNGQRVTNQLLKTGDEIRIGPYKFAYTGLQLAQYDESQNIRIEALHLKKEGNHHVVLINDISLVIPPRKFVALVGGSGTGKSTLMDALNGLRPAQKGKVLYNGQDYYTNLAAFSTQLGYVPQDDIIHRDLTVERALYYAAKLRLPDDFTEEQIKQRIEEVLEDVEMKSRRKLLVSKLSGGQRKRVSIALELLANPSVFFLDEPTSGLDPGLDRKMMLLLRKLADKGHTIILVTHATNNINNCDYICFLSQGGRLAYYGPPDGAKAYFGKTDFAEIYSALEPTEENPNIPAEAEARFRQSEEYQKYVVGPLNSGPAARVNAAQARQSVEAVLTALAPLPGTAQERHRQPADPALAGPGHRPDPVPDAAFWREGDVHGDERGYLPECAWRADCADERLDVTGLPGCAELFQYTAGTGVPAKKFSRQNAGTGGARRDFAWIRPGRAEVSLHYGVRGGDVRHYQWRARNCEGGAHLSTRTHGESGHRSLYVLQDSRAGDIEPAAKRDPGDHGGHRRAIPPGRLLARHAGNLHYAGADSAGRADAGLGHLGAGAQQ